MDRRTEEGKPSMDDDRDWTLLMLGLVLGLAIGVTIVIAYVMRAVFTSTS